MIRAFLILLVCLCTAHAAPQKDWYADFPVISAKPTDPHDAGSFVNRELAFNPDVGYNVPDGQINSSWSYIKCEMWNKHVIAKFESSVSNWPSSWPSTVTCSYPDPNGGAPFTLTLTLKNIPANLLDNYDRDWTPSSPAQINLLKKDNNGNGEGGFVTFRLPPGTWATTSQFYKAKKSGGSNWNQVFCAVQSKSGKFYIKMFVRQDSGGGNGYCEAFKVGAGTQQLNFTINRL